ncbi:ATP-binding cassette domain-containing protein, partial [Rhodovulum sulfidophilum]|uniref:ATP-binding cassette domain-containing protein n=1 Tax=Rhodovulum sulfidophilum TaxID=35806 RepID=UPI001922603C
MTPLLTLTALGIRYPGARIPALSDLGLALFAGEKLAVIGESGSGKSTLARALAGLLPAGTEVSGRIDWTEPLPRPGQ